ncbi:MAG: hypothetical protein QXE43_00690 [Candidatus Aenigmatarchaeota archaeon]
MKENLSKILIVTLSLLIPLLILFLSKPTTEIIIKDFKNIECDEIIKIGSKISSINNIDIKTIEDFENVKKELRPNQTFFIILDNKIVRCNALENFDIEVIEIEKTTYFKPINLERIVLENNERNLKILNLLGYNYYLIDFDKIILPYDKKLYLLLTAPGKLDFYLERNLEKENETVKLMDKEIHINELYEIFDEVIIGEKNVTVRKYLFNQDFIEDFDFKIRYFYPVAINFVNITFKINQNASKILLENLKEVPFRLIQLEKYYDAELVIKINNITILSYPLPYGNYENYISILITNLENPNELKKIIAAQLLKAEEIKTESYFKILKLDIVLVIIFLILFTFFFLKTKNLSLFYFLPYIILSFFFELTIPIFFSILFFFTLLNKKTIDFRLLFYTFVSTLLFLFYLQKIYFSFSILFLSLSFFVLINLFINRFKNFEAVSLLIYTSISLILFFSNSLISFSLLLVVFLYILSRSLYY